MPHPPSPQWSALLMAGGESRRMGSDKAMLDAGGMPLWRRQVHTLERAGAEEIIVARAGRAWNGEPGLITVPDARPACGPLGGLVAGMRQAKFRWLLVLAVDLPWMPAAFLRAMIERSEKTGRGVAPAIDGRFEPLAAVYESTCLAVAEECLTAGKLPLQGVVRRCQSAGLMRSLAVRDEERIFFHNVNTPEDLAELRGNLRK